MDLVSVTQYYFVYRLVLIVYCIKLINKILPVLYLFYDISCNNDFLRKKKILLLNAIRPHLNTHTQTHTHINENSQVTFATTYVGM